MHIYKSKQLGFYIELGRIYDVAILTSASYISTAWATFSFKVFFNDCFIFHYGYLILLFYMQQKTLWTSIKDVIFIDFIKLV